VLSVIAAPVPLATAMAVIRPGDPEHAAPGSWNRAFSLLG
jgi:hypothetical protein